MYVQFKTCIQEIKTETNTIPPGVRTGKSNHSVQSDENENNAQYVAIIEFRTIKYHENIKRKYTQDLRPTQFQSKRR